jgi:hypothetical protein
MHHINLEIHKINMHLELRVMLTRQEIGTFELCSGLMVSDSVEKSGKI